MTRRHAQERDERIDPTLADLAHRINEAHERALAGLRTSIEAARDAGEALLKAKAWVPHGCWLRWLTDFCPTLTPRTAQTFMVLARRWADLGPNTKRISHLTDALRVIRALDAATADAPPMRTTLPSRARVETLSPPREMCIAVPIVPQPVSEPKMAQVRMKPEAEEPLTTRQVELDYREELKGIAARALAVGIQILMDALDESDEEGRVRHEQARDFGLRAVAQTR